MALYQRLYRMHKRMYIDIIYVTFKARYDNVLLSRLLRKHIILRNYLRMFIRYYTQNGVTGGGISNRGAYP